MPTQPTASRNRQQRLLEALRGSGDEMSGQQLHRLLENGSAPWGSPRCTGTSDNCSNRVLCAAGIYRQERPYMPRLNRIAITSHAWTVEAPKHWIIAQFTDSQFLLKNNLDSRCCSTRWNSSAFALSANTITLSQPDRLISSHCTCG
jgi:hypothetical protein